MTAWLAFDSDSVSLRAVASINPQPRNGRCSRTVAADARLPRSAIVPDPDVASRCRMEPALAQIRPGQRISAIWVNLAPVPTRTLREMLI